jgi:type I restriction-modification system DNA methylase subunit/restriction endonuclease S subunit
MSNSKYKINSEEDLINHFHNIHNLIRNKFGQYGKNALAIFNFFLGLKLLEPAIKNGKIQLSPNCYFSELVKLKGDRLIEQVDNVVYEVYKNDLVRKALFHHLPFEKFTTNDNILDILISRINAITPEIIERYDIAGRNYEYFIGFIQKKNKGSKSGSQIDDLGQYFTRREIGRYMIKKVNPKPNKTAVPLMVDTFCGSGGFLIEYIKHMNKCAKIHWESQINNICGYDIDDQIVKSTRIEAISLTGVLPCKLVNNQVESNIEMCDSFTHTFNRKFDYYFTNPPYGGDKNKGGKKGQQDQFDDKVKLKDAGKEIKHIAKYGSINKDEIDIEEPKTKKKTRAKTKEYMINGDNKETLSFLLGMGLLNKNGCYAGVLKQGVFFDKKFTEMRKQLIENYEVEYVISVPQDDFLNTTTKTSILIFRNTGNKTKQIKFCDIEIIKKEIINEEGDKEVHITGIKEVNPHTKEEISFFDTKKAEFTNIKDNYLIANYKELVNKDYTLNYKSFIKEDIKVGKGFKVVKLGDICDILPTNKNNTSNGLENGPYRFYNSSQDKKLYCIDYEINKLSIILGNGGNFNIHIDTKFTASKHVSVIQLKNNNDELLLWYIYYYLSNKSEILANKFNGSTMGWLNKETINNLKIVIPESIDTIKLYLDYLNPTNKSLQSLQSLQKEKEQSICGKIKLLTMMGNKGTDYDEYKLGDIFDLKSGNVNSNEITNTGEYPFYNAGMNNPIGTHNKFTFDGEKYILFIKSGGNAKNKISDSHALGLNYLVNGKIACNIAVYKLIEKNNKIKLNIDYIHYYLLVLKSTIQSQANYTTGNGNVDMDHFRNLYIRILKPELIKKYGLDYDFEFMDKLRNDIQNTLKCQEEITKQMMKLVLDQTTQNTNEAIEDEQQEDEQQEEEYLEDEQQEEEYLEDEQQEEYQKEEEQEDEQQEEECLEDEQDECQKEEQKYYEEAEEYPYQEKLDEIVNLAEQIKEIEEKIKITKATVTKNKLETQKKQLQNKIKVLQKEYEKLSTQTEHIVKAKKYEKIVNKKQ